MPTEASSLSGQGVAALAAGGEQSLFLRANGSVLRCGRVELRASTAAERWAEKLGVHVRCGRVPEEVAGLGDGVEAGRVVAIAAGNEHALAVSAAGEAWAWGENDDGQCGAVGFPDGERVVAAPRRMDGDLGGRRAVAVAAGYNHSLVTCDDGSLWACGEGGHGRLGVGGRENRFALTRVAGLQAGL